MGAVACAMGRKCPPGLSRVFLYYFWSFAASFSFFFWRCRWLTICHSLTQVCFLGVGCEFGLKYSIDQSNNFVRVGNSKTGPALLRLIGIPYMLYLYPQLAPVLFCFFVAIQLEYIIATRSLTMIKSQIGISFQNIFTKILTVRLRLFRGPREKDFIHLKICPIPSFSHA